MRDKITRPVAAVLTAGMLLVGGAFALSEGDSLISLKYLNNTIIPGIVSQGATVEQGKLDQAYADALNKLEQVDQATPHGNRKGLYSAYFTARQYKSGDKIQLETGSGLLMIEGSATITHNGTVIDVTKGAAVSSGVQAETGHRYLVAEDTTAQVVCGSAVTKVGVQGVYSETRK